MERIVFYDGECGLCQRAVSMLYQLDSNKILRFAPLNGETYKKYFSDVSDMSTIVFYNNGKLSIRSDAAIEILYELGGWKKMVVLFKIFPRFIRDKIYLFIARHRKKVSCIILKRDERFLK